MKLTVLLRVLGCTSLMYLMAAEAQADNKQDSTSSGGQDVVQENILALCQDGADNDKDNFVDCADQDCQAFIICANGATANSGTAAGGGAGNGAEQAVDLDSLDEAGSAPPPPPGQPAGHPGSGHPGGHPGAEGGGFKMPKFKLFFDFLIEYELKTKMFNFTRDHAHVILELSATDWLTFRTDIALEPEFYEAIFMLGSVAEFRVGKIIVPFGQNEFHHMIGGRVDKDSLFLPDIWGDYGLAFKHFVYNGDFAAFDYSLYIIKGFPANSDGTEPKMSGNANALIEDNNQMKGIGIRPKLGLGRAVTLGTSWYLDAWDKNNDRWMLIYGVDVELGYDLIPVPFLRDLRLRFEIAWAENKLADRNNPYHGLLAGDTFGIMPNYGIRRSGYNIELTYRILPWLFIRYREGWLNDNSRVKNANDLLVHEPGILAQVGPVQFSLMGQILQRRYNNRQLEEPLDKNDEYSKLLFRVMLRY